ncbi:MAG TPA: hypothetical protein VG269_22940 [Tepidisphaeraceae bacterium]|jgi:hypothetical protein|nr:hypothetical protein [Tepidisphaeraceae bacterium]
MANLVADHPADETEALSRDAVEAAVRAVEPAAVFIQPWLLQNLIGLDRGPGASPFAAARRKVYLIDRGRLQDLAQDAGFPLPADLAPFDTLLLLARAEPDWFAGHSTPDVLRGYWQLLFHARIVLELREKLAEPACGAAAVQERIERIGRAAFNEARFVLQRERRLPHACEDREAYCEFVAACVEMANFRPDLLPVYFPLTEAGGGWAAAVRQDVDIDEILRRTRPAGAADPLPTGAPDTALPGDRQDAPRDRSDRTGLARDVRRSALLSRGDKAAATGNAVRAALLRMRVARAAPQETGARASALAALNVLPGRLQNALGLSEASIAQWRPLLAALLEQSAQGWWNPEARLLYDLQKVCGYAEHEIYSVGVVEWLLERCRRPLRRPQPRQRLVLQIKSLRSAQRRVPRARLAPAQRAALTHLLDHALHHVEAALHDAVRPAIVDALAAGELLPRNAVEQVAGNKLVEELIDGLVHRGFLTLGNVRDAISRNQLKLDDVPGFGPYFRGDRLLRIDRALSDSLDGVYHRGEAYLRFFQRASSIFFATHSGRFFTRTVLMPLGGAALILEGLDHTLLLLVRLATGWKWLKLSRLDEFRHESFGPYLLDNLPFVFLTLMLLGALNWPAFRTAVWRALRGIGRGIKLVLIDVPCWIAARPWLRAMARSREALWLFRFVLKPLLIALPALLLVPRTAARPTRWLAIACAFAAVNVVLNTRTGRAVERAVSHWLRLFLSRLTVELFSNVFHTVMRFFQKLMEDVDRALYAVDEWLRYRSGQRRRTLVAKAVLGMGWFFVAYFVRFAVNLLGEPQVNPIKHFPVVTVSHKLILPTWGLFRGALETLGMHAGRAGTTATAIVFSIPGIFGFLAWELRSNWKLYRANRPAGLKPVQVGSHGESMARLLRPGFHSGTVPKIFAKLRRAQAHLFDGGRASAGALATLHKQHHAADHVREAVSHFIEREFIVLLNAHPAWRDTPLSAGLILLGPTHVAAEIFCPALGPGPAVIRFEQRSGWILAGMDPAAWTTGISPEKSRLLSAALLGLYKIAGVDIVTEQVHRVFGPQALAFELTPGQLTLWRGGNFEEPITVALTDDAPDGTPSSQARQMLLRWTSVTWEQWVATWEPSPGP